MTRPFGEGDWIERATSGIPQGEMTIVVAPPTFEVLELRLDLFPPHGRADWSARLRVVRGVHRAAATGDDDETRWRRRTSGDLPLYDLVESVEARMARELMG
ncbi:MAG TPA: hypothetical protein VMZ50_08405 [Phycisphaerae bacterium]|nr:hypothetical protein [Phycisphaerae bacterium]